MYELHVPIEVLFPPLISEIWVLCVGGRGVDFSLLGKIFFPAGHTQSTQTT